MIKNKFGRKYKKGISLNEDLKKEIHNKIQESKNYKEISNEYGIHYNTIKKIENNIGITKKYKNSLKENLEFQSILTKIVKDEQNLTYEEIIQKLGENGMSTPSQGYISKLLKYLNFSYKKVTFF